MLGESQFIVERDEDSSIDCTERASECGIVEVFIY